MKTDSYPCPECGKKISEKNYDSDFEMYECPKCEGMFTFDELLEGRGPGPEATEAPVKAVPVAKGKKRQEEMVKDAEADAAHIEAITKNVKQGAKEEKHRDEIQTGMVLNIMADEIESICDEAGISIDRLNAREYFAMNLYRPLMLAGFKAREQEVKFVGCVDHS